jgi:hypothetical protein
VSNHTGSAAESDPNSELAELDAQLRRIDIAGIHASHRASILPQYPTRLRLALTRNYVTTAGPVRQVLQGEARRRALSQGRGVDSWAQANIDLAAAHARLKRAKAHLAWSDSQVRDMAQQCAEICASVTRGRDVEDAYRRVGHCARHHGIRMPEPTRGKTLAGCVARLCDPKWWRRAIRSSYARQAEEIERDLGLVSRRTGLYASHDSVSRRRAQRLRNRNLLESVHAVNELGECFTLAELSDANVTNPKCRRAELMTRIAGFEQYAKREGHDALFITVTLPSRFHKALAKSGAPNPKYDGSSVADGHTFLCRQWAKLRSHLKRNSHIVYGLRIAEPHHDGTPHWHLLLFVEQSSREAVLAAFQRYFDPPEEAEPGSPLRRVDVVPIDASRGSATGYVVKYVCKNIDGDGVGEDLEAWDALPTRDARVTTATWSEEHTHAVSGDVADDVAGDVTGDAPATTGQTDAHLRDATETAKRVDTWASTHGIRQFQQIGGPPVTVWRELRRVHHACTGPIEAARTAAEDQEWDRFIDAMGGVNCRAADRPVQLHTGRSSRPGQYGEPIARQIKGVRCGAIVVATRIHTWTLVRVPSPASPWTCVNNCTQIEVGTDADYHELARRFDQRSPNEALRSSTSAASSNLVSAHASRARARATRHGDSTSLAHVAPAEKRKETCIQFCQRRSKTDPPPAK